MSAVASFFSSNALEGVGACLAVVVSIVLYFFSSNNQRRIAQATVIQKLHDQAAYHGPIVKVLERRHDERVKRRGDDGFVQEKLSEDELVQAREFLRYLEMLMLILEGGVLKEEDVFPLFAFRIFVAVNDPDVRSAYLVETNGVSGKCPRRSFCAVYALHHRLLRYLQNKYGTDFSRILGELHITKEEDISWEGYYAEGVGNYVRHRWRPFVKIVKRRVKTSVYDHPGWPGAN